MDFHKLVTRFRQFGGTRLVWEYAKLGALWPGVKAGVNCFLKGRSFKGIYPEVLTRVEPFLVEKYAPVVSRFKFQVSSEEVNTDSANDVSTGFSTIKPIWFCWLQGLEQAPPIVHACYNSLKRNIPDREIKVVDNENWREHVDLPDYVVQKWEKGKIPAAMFSDLLRLELLIKYGGTWIDSTVLCTGFNSLKVQGFKAFLDADLFLFQYTPKGTTAGISISNWFISACKGNKVQMVLRDMLYAYWKDYDCVLDYYIFHLFFAMIAKEYPEQIAAMPYGSSKNSIALMHNLGKKFEQTKWDRLISKVSFHKLSYRVSKSMQEDKNNYYSAILNIYG